MIRVLNALLVVALLLLAPPAIAQPLSGQPLVTALQRGGYVLAMRHASSPREAPDERAANRDNAGRERQLDDKGRTTATAMGEAFKALHIPIGEVVTSPTYRARETVRLAGLPNPRPQPELGDGGQSMQGVTPAQTTWLKMKATEFPRGTNTVLVTHLPNLSAAFPDWTRGLEDGETLVLGPDGKSGALLVARVKIDQWPHLTDGSGTGAPKQGSAAGFKDNYADVNGVRLHYVSVGQGPLVLFVHGYPSFWYQWKDQMLEMGRDHLAVGVDLRGYNLSSKPKDVDQYKMKYLVEDLRQLAEKLAGPNRKFVLVAHDWGGIIAWTFAMFHPEMLDRLIIINAPHPHISERELRENPAQRYASNYHFVDNGYLAPGEQPIDERDTKEIATRRAHAGFVEAAVKSGRYTEADRQMWVDAWSQAGSTTAGLNYYRANHRNPPFNDRHPAATVPHSWSAKEVTEGAKSPVILVPTLVLWGVKDTAVLTGNLSGLDKFVENLSVKLYPDDDHWVMIEKGNEIGQDIRRFLEDRNFPKDSVYRRPQP